MGDGGMEGWRGGGVEGWRGGGMEGRRDGGMEAVRMRRGRTEHMSLYVLGSWFPESQLSCPVISPRARFWDEISPVQSVLICPFVLILSASLSEGICLNQWCGSADGNLVAMSKLRPFENMARYYNGVNGIRCL